MAAISYIGSVERDAGVTASTGSFTPAAGVLLWVAVYAARSISASPTLTEIAGNQTGLQMQLIATLEINSAVTEKVYIFIADRAALAVNTAFNFSTDDSATGFYLSWGAISGMSRFGANAVRQTASDTYVGGTQTAECVFSSAALTENPILGYHAAFFGVSAVTPPANFTELHETSWGTAEPVDYTTEIVHRDSGHTSNTVTWGSAEDFCNAIVIEFDTSPAVAPSTAVHACWLAQA